MTAIMKYYYDDEGYYAGVAPAILNPDAVEGENPYYVQEGEAMWTLEVPPLLEADYSSLQFSTGTWSVVPDYLGASVYNEAGEVVVVDVRGDLAVGLSLDATPAYLAKEAIKAFKASRTLLVEASTITIAGNTYDANEISQSRMARAIMAAEISESTVIPLWVMSNNAVVLNIPLNDFKQALAASIISMGQIWVPPA